MPSNNPIVLLRERDGDRYLPIWVAQQDATAIAHAQRGVVPPRPMTHDLLASVLKALGRQLTEVRIVALRDNVFHAELLLDNGVTIDSRSSDAIALALRTNARIVGAEEVLEACGVAVPDADEDEVEKFREFLDSVSPEDFTITGDELGGEGPPPPA
jgi:uncharacterized protein